MLKQSSRYRNIAFDIAKQIAEGNIIEGSKLKGRSVLAGSYNVSPETIRKSIALLEEYKIVQVVPGSGINVLSKSMAAMFMRDFHEKDKMVVLKNELKDLLDQRESLDEHITTTLKSIAEYSLSVFNEYNQFLFLEIPVAESIFLNKSILNSGFWEATGGTIVALRRGETMLISPNPMEMLLEGDIIIYIKAKQAEETFISLGSD